MAWRLKHEALVGEQPHRLADRLAGVAGVAADIGNGRQRVARPEYPVDDLLPEPIRYLPIWPRVREFAVAHSENNTRSHSSLVDYNCRPNPCISRISDALEEVHCRLAHVGVHSQRALAERADGCLQHAAGMARLTSS